MPEDEKGEKTRVYTGCDGVMVPIITEAEKVKRRDNIKAKRRRSGKKRKALPPRKHGSDKPWKEFKVAFFYSEGAEHQHVAFTHGNHVTAECFCVAKPIGCSSAKRANAWALSTAPYGFASRWIITSPN